MTAKTILIVEDDMLLQDNLQIYLAARHFRILQAGNVDEAVAIIGKEDIDLILLDLLLPGKHGIVLLETLKKKRIRTPVIVITNTDPSDKIEQCLQLGACDFVVKSNTPLSGLLSLIVRHCGAGGKKKSQL